MLQGYWRWAHQLRTSAVYVVSVYYKGDGGCMKSVVGAARRQEVDVVMGCARSNWTRQWDEVLAVHFRLGAQPNKV